MQASALWLPAAEASGLLGHSDPRTLKRDLKRGKYASKLVPAPTGMRYEVDLYSLPKEAQTRYWQSHLGETATILPDAAEVEADMDELHSAPAWARGKAEKYLALLNATEGMKGAELKAFIADWNARNKELATSYPSLMRARQEYKVNGIASLIAGYGKTAGMSSVDDEWFEFFKSLYLKEGGPSALSCWYATLGYAAQKDLGIRKETFPTHAAFLRRLKREVSPAGICLKREGESRYNRKWARSINRDTSKVPAGACWISDHAQLDVLVIDKKGRAVAPWVTVWRDMSSGKWLGWVLHTEAPNSDHIFQAFYFAALAYGRPTDIYIDNGKDYRCRDFTGGRAFHKVEVDPAHARALVEVLGIRVHFALPYNAQAKQVERDFRTNKEWWSKHQPGYRGGNHVERPEGLNDEVRSRKLLTFEETVPIIDLFVTSVLNAMPGQGKNLRGQSRDAFFAANYKPRPAITEDALKLCCMRVSEPKMITGNGIKDAEFGLFYWSEWMMPLKGTRVYLRRDPKRYHAAWVFKEEDDEYLGRTVLEGSLNGLVTTDTEKQELRERQAAKKREKKLLEAAAATQQRPAPMQFVEYMASAAKVLGGGQVAHPAPQGVELHPMNFIAAKDKQVEEAGRMDVPKPAAPAKPKRTLVNFAFERNDGEKRKSGT